MRELKTPSRAWSWLGLETVETGEGTATVEMRTTEDMANHSGFVHGGMISALADSAMGRSVRTLTKCSGQFARNRIPSWMLSAVRSSVSPS